MPLQSCTRGASRTPTDAIVRCQPHTSNGTARFTDGVMRNFSSSGAYIETSRPFKSGTTLLMRMLRYAPATPDAAVRQDQPRTICLAEVKWQRAREEADTRYYGMGIRYVD